MCSHYHGNKGDKAELFSSAVWDGVKRDVEITCINFIIMWIYVLKLYPVIIRDKVYVNVVRINNKGVRFYAQKRLSIYE